ncbi:MAG: cysteine synthase A [Chromatiales bacterium]|jgi:cysteine synthase A|nr:cysteine synthase A [Chromatiales bacterium]
MDVFDSTLGTIGRTPLIRLREASRATSCEILGKAEFLNPGGSVKDRTALGIVRDAERTGLLQPGSTVVEGTAGNTGIGLALVGDALGYRTIIVMPNTQSQEKVDALRAYGAEVRQIPAVPYKNPEHFVHTSRRLAEEMNESRPGSAFWANQFDNTANYLFHKNTTGPEIWAQTDGHVDGFVCAVGTGGTLAGVGTALKSLNPAVRIGLADPGGSGLFAYYDRGEIAMEGSSITEGIGNSRITANLEHAPVDKAYKIPDEEAIPLVYDMIRNEGLCLGGSSGINVAAAMRMARELGPGHTIVTILCDSGLRYKGRLFNPEFLRSKDIEFPNFVALMGED